MICRNIAQPRVSSTGWKVARDRQPNDDRNRPDPWPVWGSRMILMTAVFASTWCIAGHYPMGRLLTLALTGLALGVALIDSKFVSTRHSGVPNVLLIAFAAVILGVLQLVPCGDLSGRIAPGVAEFHARYSVDVDGSILQTAVTSKGHDDVTGNRSTTGGAETVSTGLTLSRWDTKTAVSTLVIGLVGMMLGWLLFQTDSSRMFLLAGIAVCGASQVFWGIIQQVAHPDLIVWGYENPGNSSPFGSFLNRNHAADFLGMSIGCTIGMVAWFRSRWGIKSGTSYDRSDTSSGWLMRSEVLATALLLCWLSIGFLLTLSRGAWLSAVVTGVVVTCLWRASGSSRDATSAKRRAADSRSRRCISVGTPILLMGVLVLLAAAGLIWSGTLDRISRRFSEMQLATMTADSRIDHWAAAFPAVLHYLPFGSGLGTYGYAHLPLTEPLTGTWYTHAHNQFLEVLVEAGFAGIALMLAGLVCSVLAITRGLRSRRRASAIGMALAALIAVVMQSIHSVGDFGVAMPANLLVLSVLIGAGVSTVRPRQDPFQPIDSDAEKGTRSGGPPLKFNHSRNRVSRWSPRPMSFALAVAMMVVPSLMHLGHRVHIDHALNETRFKSSTPSPTVEDAKQAIGRLSRLIERLPDCQQPRLRRARLRVHLASRERYDKLKAEAAEAGIEIDAQELWRIVSLENAVFVIGKDTTGQPDSEFRTLQAELSSQLAEEPELRLARRELQELIAMNPMQIKAQLLLTQVAAVTGDPWRDRLQRLEDLCPGGPETSFMIGLLAMSAGDFEQMLRQWKRTIQGDRTKIGTIIEAARQNVSDDVLVELLVPENWEYPFRMSLACKEVDSADPLRQRLLEQALALIDRSEMNDSRRLNALYQVSSEMGDYSSAAEWSLKAVQLEPQNAILRYQAAKALVKSERLDEAEAHVRVATHLVPHDLRYKRLLSFLQRRHR